MITLEAVQPIGRAVYTPSSIAPDNVPTPVIPDRISTVRHLGYHHRSIRVSRSLTMCRGPRATVHVGVSDRKTPATAAERAEPRGAGDASELDLKRVLSRRTPIPKLTNCYPSNGQAYRCRAMLDRHVARGRRSPDPMAPLVRAPGLQHSCAAGLVSRRRQSSGRRSQG
jgi:hypothetical protein